MQRELEDELHACVALERVWEKDGVCEAKAWHELGVCVCA